MKMSCHNSIGVCLFVVWLLMISQHWRHHDTALKHVTGAPHDRVNPGSSVCLKCSKCTSQVKERQEVSRSDGSILPNTRLQATSNSAESPILLLRLSHCR